MSRRIIINGKTVPPGKKAKLDTQKVDLNALIAKKRKGETK